MFRMYAAMVLTAATVLMGCNGGPVVRDQPERTPSPPSPAAQAQPAGSPRAVMAYVNGEPIYLDRLHDLLVRSHGMGLAQQLIALRVLQGEAARRGVTVLPEDVRAEERRIMRRLFPGVDDPARARLTLEQVREQQGLSVEQWQLLMEMNAHQSALVGDVEVSEAELRDAFGTRYGRQVQVRHIQVPSLSDAQAVVRRLEAGERFEDVLAEVSTNVSREEGGLLPPFGRNEPTIPEAFRSAAFALEEIGQVSDPVQVMTTYHILRLEGVLEPEGVAFEDVRDELAVEVRQAKRDRLRQRVLMDLVQEAQSAGRIRFVEPYLRQQAEAQRQMPGGP